MIIKIQIFMQINVIISCTLSSKKYTGRYFIRLLLFDSEGIKIKINGSEYLW